jgi:hypothetical protein
MKRNVGARMMISAVVALGMNAMSSIAEAEDVGNATRSQHDASQFTYARLYCTPDNETHFTELTVELD